jgi:hypothetical protein
VQVSAAFCITWVAGVFGAFLAVGLLFAGTAVEATAGLLYAG